MAEENKQDQQTEEQKQSNRVFSQSDYDKAIAQKEKEVKELFKDYDDLKKTVSEFNKIKEEQELAKLSEIEKVTVKASELENKLKSAETINAELTKKMMKLEVLSDSRFSVLPDPYKRVVDGETVDDIRNAAEKALNDFNEVLKNAGKSIITSGVPPTQPKPTQPKPFTIQEMFTKRLEVRGNQKGG